LSQIRAHLSAIQSKILVTLFQTDGSRYLPNEAVLEKTGIAQSTWSEEQKRLIDMGLLEKKAFKMLRTNNVCRIVNFRLTNKGRTVSFNLANISRMIVQPRNELETNNSTPLSEKDFEYEVIESIEVALDSFGINLIPLVKGRLLEGIAWGDVARRPEILLTVLNDLFGKEGCATVEAMIVENLKARFVPGPLGSENDLVNLIAQLRRKKVADRILPEAPLPENRLRLEKVD
jgi:DNA-binding MarR family transcriptional regulator